MASSIMLRTDYNKAKNRPEITPKHRHKLILLCEIQCSQVGTWCWISSLLVSLKSWTEGYWSDWKQERSWYKKTIFYLKCSRSLRKTLKHLSYLYDTLQLQHLHPATCIHAKENNLNYYTKVRMVTSLTYHNFWFSVSTSLFLDYIPEVWINDSTLKFWLWNCIYLLTSTRYNLAFYIMGYVKVFKLIFFSRKGKKSSLAYSSKTRVICP